jgi:SAM-dependent methyltransferase
MPLDEPIRLPSKKARRMPATMTYLAFRLLRRCIPDRALLRFLLAFSWAVNRITYEQALATIGLEEGMRLFRPQTIPFLEQYVRTGDHVLELGGGPGLFTPTLAAQAASVTYVDRDPTMLAAARRRCSSLENVDFWLGEEPPASDGGGFDTVVMLHVLEHLRDPVAALAALPPDSDRLLVEVPDLESVPAVHVRRRFGAPLHWDDDHRSEFTAESLANTIEQAGWRVTVLEKHDSMLLAVGERTA